jgi:hypothetical protein
MEVGIACTNLPDAMLAHKNGRVGIENHIATTAMCGYRLRHEPFNAVPAGLIRDVLAAWQ